MILNEMSFVCAKVEPCYETNQTFFYLILNEMAKVCITESCTFTFDNDSQDKIKSSYRSGTVNSNTVNSKFHLIRSFFEIFARFLSFHV